MILSDKTIENYIDSGLLVVDPFDPQAIQPASLDVRLGVGAYYAKSITKESFVNPSNKLLVNDAFVEMPDATSIAIDPGDFILATTLERFEFPDNVVGVVNGKSSLGRLGLLIHATAGFIDPGFKGQITLELSNVSRTRLILNTGMRIGQVSFQFLDRPARKPYGHPDLNSKYVEQSGATMSKYHLNTE